MRKWRDEDVKKGEWEMKGNQQKMPLKEYYKLCNNLSYDVHNMHEQPIKLWLESWNIGSSEYFPVMRFSNNVNARCTCI